MTAKGLQSANTAHLHAPSAIHIPPFGYLNLDIVQQLQDLRE
jgi:hypothetical protein